MVELCDTPILEFGSHVWRTLWTRTRSLVGLEPWVCGLDLGLDVEAHVLEHARYLQQELGRRQLVVPLRLHGHGFSQVPIPRVQSLPLGASGSDREGSLHHERDSGQIELRLASWLRVVRKAGALPQPRNPADSWICCSGPQSIGRIARLRRTSAAATASAFT